MDMNLESLKVVKFTCRYGNGKNDTYKACYLGKSIPYMIVLLETKNLKIEKWEILAECGEDKVKPLMIEPEVAKLLISYVEQSGSVETA